VSADVRNCPVGLANNPIKQRLLVELLHWQRNYLRKKGLEPLRPFGHQLLRLARLPIPPLPLGATVYHFDGFLRIAGDIRNEIWRANRKVKGQKSKDLTQRTQRKEEKTEGREK
jgi:hypothetical protein